MQIMKSNKAQFEYDIHALVKAFYPEWELKVLTPDSVIKDRKIREMEPVMELSFGDTKVELKVRSSLHNYVWEHTDQVDPAEYKNAFKRFLYTSLQEETGISLPWGNLTGIRPTKIAMTMLEQGKAETEIAEFLKAAHFVSPQKTALGIEIAKRERKILSTLHYEDGYSLYVGIPFCPTTCLYCSFTSYPISLWRERVEEYLGALEREIDAAAALYKDKILDTVYIGGGTPFVFDVNQLERVYSAVAREFPDIPEYTVEAGRPDMFTEEKLALSKRYGVTRICVNPQTFNDATLAKIGRAHTSAQTVSAYESAKKYGFDINLDLIAGLADESVNDFVKSLDKAISLDPANITVHTLSLKSGAKLKEEVKRLNISGINEMVDLSRQKLSKAGYAPYYMYRQKYQAGGLENVGWCKQGKACVYNIDVMEEISDNIAVGANAISKRLFGEENRIERLASPKDIPTYINKTQKIIADRIKLFT